MSKFSQQFAKQEDAQAEQQAVAQAKQDEVLRKRNLISNAAPNQMVAVANEIAGDRDWLLDSSMFKEFMAKGGRKLNPKYRRQYEDGRECLLALRTDMRMADLSSAAKSKNYGKVAGVFHGLAFDYRFRQFGFALVMDRVLDIMSDHPEFELQRKLDEKLSVVWLESLIKRQRAAETTQLREERREALCSLGLFEGSALEHADALDDFGQKFGFSWVMDAHGESPLESVVGLFLQEYTSDKNDKMLKSFLVRIRMGLTAEKKSANGSVEKYVESALENVQHLLDRYEIYQKAARHTNQNQHSGDAAYRGQANRPQGTPQPNLPKGTKSAPAKPVRGTGEETGGNIAKKLVKDGSGGNAIITDQQGEFPLLKPNHGSAPQGRGAVAHTGKKSGKDKGDSKGKSSPKITTKSRH